MKLRTAIVIAGVCTLFNSANSVHADTSFSYQGELKDGGALANGSYDLDFSLWDALGGGSQVGSTINLVGVTVGDGRFTVELDFGADAFDNSARWLQIDVNGMSLSPRQPITRAPYSIQTRGIFVNDAQEVGIGTTNPLDELHVRGVQATLRLEDDDDPGSFTQFMDAQPTQLRINKVNSSDGVLLDLNPKPTDGTSYANVRFFRETDTTGPKSVQFLRGNFSTNTSASIGVDGADSFFQIHGGNVGIGTAAPQHTLHVVGDGHFESGVTAGPGAMRMPIAYGVVEADGTLRSGSSTVGTTINWSAGVYTVNLTGGVSFNQDTDIVQVTPLAGSGTFLVPTVSYGSSGFQVDFWRVQPGPANNQNSAFSFVVYRP